MGDVRPTSFCSYRPHVYCDCSVRNVPGAKKQSGDLEGYWGFRKSVLPVSSLFHPSSKISFFSLLHRWRVRCTVTGDVDVNYVTYLNTRSALNSVIDPII